MFGSVRGGLGIGVVLVGMLLAASTGIVGATVVTMGMLALPTMLKAGYDEKIATGTICASGTLGQIIPPSIVLILLAEMLQGANEEAGLLRGDLAPLPVTAIDLFAGALLPGLMLVGFFIIYLLFIARIRPQDLPLKKIDKPRLEIWKTAFFEVLPPKTISLGSIAGGGRYDNLTEIFGLKNMSGIGISFGLDRLFLVMDELKLFPVTSYNSVKVLILNFGVSFSYDLIEIANFLRSNKVNAEFYPDPIPLKKQLNLSLIHI